MQWLPHSSATKCLSFSDAASAAWTTDLDEAGSLVLASAPDHQLNRLKFPSESDYLAVEVVQERSQSQRATSLNILPGPEKDTFHDTSPERDGEQFFTEPTLP